MSVCLRLDGVDWRETLILQRSSGEDSTDRRTLQHRVLDFFTVYLHPNSPRRKSLRLFSTVSMHTSCREVQTEPSGKL